MSVLLVIKVLLKLVASIVVFALLYHRLDNKTLINSYVRIFGFSKLDDKGGSFLILNCFRGELSNKLYIYTFNNTIVFYLDLFDNLRLVINVNLY